MSRLFISLCVVLSTVALAAPPAPAAAAAAKDAPTKDAPVKADANKVLYALGALIAQRTPLASAGLTEAEAKQVFKGVTDVALGKTITIKPEEYAKQVDDLLAARRKQKSEAQLAKYVKEKGAEKSPSGLIFTSLKAGTGAQPKPTDTVKVHYRGTLTNGTEFDSSYSRNEPTEFPLNGVIPCWTEGVAKMKVGGKAKLVCPSDIAYGDRGAPPKIGPGAVLVFEIELLEVKAPAAPAAPARPEPTPNHP